MFFFFQAEDGIRDLTGTGVQTCALPIFAQSKRGARAVSNSAARRPGARDQAFQPNQVKPLRKLGVSQTSLDRPHSSQGANSAPQCVTFSLVAVISNRGSPRSGQLSFRLSK